MSELLSASVLVILSFLPFLVLIGTLIWAAIGDVEAPKGKFSWLLGGILILMLISGIGIGSSPILYPYLARAWDLAGLNLNRVNPMNPPIRGIEFELDENHNGKPIVQLKDRPSDTLWGVRIIGREPVLLPSNETLYVIPEGIKPEDVEVFWQSRIDDRTSSAVNVKK